MLEKSISAEIDRLANFIPVFFGIGIILYFSLKSECDVVYLLASLFLVSSCVFFRKIRLIGIVSILLFLGVLASYCRTHILNTPMLNEKVEYCTLFGDIELAESTQNGIRFVVSNVECEDLNLRKVSLTWRTKKSAYDYIPGSRMKFYVILDPIYNKTFDNAYDFRKQSFFNSISARGYIIRPPKLLSSPKQNQWSVFKNSLRQSIDKRIDNATQGDQAAIIKTLITGNKSELSEDIRRAYSDAGIAHILAISGLHIGIIAGLFFIFFRRLICLLSPWITLSYDIKKIASALAMIFVFGYLQISGESVPAVRSFIMYGLIVFAILLNRSAFSMRSVAVAAMAIMLVKPEAILFPSFQMSFSAVIALIAFYENRHANSTKWMAVLSLLCSSVVASVATSPFVVNTFHRLSVLGVFSNLVVVPLMSFVTMPLAVFSVLLMPLGCEHYVLQLLGYSIDFITYVAQSVTSVKYAAIQLHNPSTISFVCVVIGGLLCALLTSKIRWSGLLLVSLGLIMYCNQPKPLVYVSAYDKVVGINCDGNMCFNNLSSLRRTTADFVNSESINGKYNLKHKACKRYVKYMDDGSMIVNGFHIVRNASQIDHTNNMRTIVLNDTTRNTARILYDDGSIKNFVVGNRPWN